MVADIGVAFAAMPASGSCAKNPSQECIGKERGSKMARRSSSKRKLTSVDDGHSMTLSWSYKGIFGTFPLSRTRISSGIVDVDISNNSISHLDSARLLQLLPNLQKLNVADNLIMSLASFIALGKHRHLRELDVHGNPCMPAGGRRALLAALLVPEISADPHFVSAATEATAMTGPSHADTEHEPMPKRLPNSVSSPALLEPVEQQPSFLERPYRSRHLQASPKTSAAEAGVRRRLDWLRCVGDGSMPLRSGPLDDCDVAWKPGHVAANKRRVKPCLPRAHLYEAPVGAPCSKASPPACAGAGTTTWFPCLVTLNGAPVTVRDLEDAAECAGEDLPIVRSAQTQSAAARENTAEPRLDLQRRDRERYADYVLRVRGEFIRHRRRGHTEPDTRMYSEPFDEWSQKVNAAEGCDCDVQEERNFKLTACDPTASLSEGVLTSLARRVTSLRKKEYVFQKEVEAEQRLETMFWQSLRASHERAGPETSVAEQRRPRPLDAEVEAVVVQDLGAAPAPTSGKLAPSSPPRVPPRSRPESAPAAGRSRPMPAAATSERKKATRHILRHRPCDHKGIRLQARALSRCYVKATTSELPACASAAEHGIVSGSRVKNDSSAGIDVSELNVSNHRVADAIARLRQRGVAPGAVSDVVCRQWLKQLAEDYPDEFCNPSSFADTGLDARSILSARDEHALVESKLWVLDVHGDPKVESDWKLRDAWLDASGHLWFDGLVKEETSTGIDARCKVTGSGTTERSTGCSQALDDTTINTRLSQLSSPVLYLGGRSTADLIVLKVERTAVVEALGGRPVHAMVIHLPGARYSRKKYLAAQDAETRERWMRACSSVVQHGASVVPSLGASVSRDSFATARSAS